jgi:hypothetical protein
MKKFGIDEQQTQITDEKDRFKRPISVAIFGCLISAGTVGLILSRTGSLQSGTSAAGLLIFTIFAFTFSCLYAFLGWRYGRTLAHKVLGTVGIVIVLAGVAFVIWLLKVYAP